MASVQADSLDDFLPYILTSDTKKRLHTYEQLVGYLRCSYTSLECRNTEKVIDGLIAWISSSNYKVMLFWLAVRIWVPIEINRALCFNTYPYCLNSLVHSDACFRAFWVCFNLHSNYFDFANKNYFQKIAGVGPGCAFQLKQIFRPHRKC